MGNNSATSSSSIRKFGTICPPWIEIQTCSLYLVLWLSERATEGTIRQHFYFNLRRDHRKNFLWVSQLWVGRRKDPILGYVRKLWKKKLGIACASVCENIKLYKILISNR